MNAAYSLAAPKGLRDLPEALLDSAEASALVIPLPIWRDPENGLRLMCYGRSLYWAKNVIGRCMQSIPDENP
jgi:hypothetical protein